MKIAIVSDHETLGGAAQSTSRLAEALCDGDEVTRLVLFPDGEPHPWRTWPLIREESVARRQLHRVPRRLWPTRFPRPGTLAFYQGQLARMLRRLRPDIVHVHNLHGGANWGWGPELVATAAQFAPVVWTLHDMWSFTGRCAYRYDCQRHVTGCDASCPTAHEPPTLAPTDIAAAWEARRRLFAALPELVAVTPSRWLADEARRGLWAGHRVEVIPYGVPTETFTPLPRAGARRVFGLPLDGPVLLIAAHDLTERRKGADVIQAAAPHLAGVTVLTMGHGALHLPGVQVRSLGWLGDDVQKALAYNAADALLHPAPVDNLPNVVLESLACGTPVIAMPIGGVPEMVRPGVTGWLAEATTGEALGAAVGRAVGELGGAWRERCRRVAEVEYPLEVQARRYQRFHDDLRHAHRRRAVG